ncbi:hypothetical protein [Halarcobacter bivalviorum]|uniref:Uncharacterized protein n=1 Tax=Halarcobacter bivalviorum TaxID=663364 RepID=A0AAX2AD80_9BACT|nr:hypothetical protein [Halarcobacter bivalviorum]AXH11961.1 hypothetical protein ABIV_0954 [Halarcobacter bivalviorum]RXK07278.1 hypothetical protein CRU97_03990 [Halarcobacter bivalviorum]RXK11078.1 hypothetical protein CRV05_01545 [Halarcobacter bivalviorum]
MSKSLNNNSVKNSKVDLIKLGSNSTPKAFSKDTSVKEQVVNARKAASQNKAKAKKKAKMAKASRKKAR